MKKIILSLLLALAVLFLSPSANAQGRPRNIFGAHLISPTHDEIRAACRLVNANGGQWGSLVRVLQEGELTPENLQAEYKILFEERCLYILRLATKIDDQGKWVLPSESTTNYITDLVKKTTPPSRGYYQLGNEPNRGDELGGDCLKNIPEYAHWFQKTKQAILEVSPEAVVMLGALDKAAPMIAPEYCDVKTFYKELIKAEPKIFDDISVLSTHSYFTGHNGFGCSLLTSHHAEKRYLFQLGVDHALGMSVIISETGGNQGANTVSNLQNAIALWQRDSKLLSLNVFVYHACDEKFHPFSLVDCPDSQMTPLGNAIYSNSKIVGEPEFTFSATTVGNFVKDLAENLDFITEITIENKSTDAIRRGEYELVLIGPSFDYSFSDFHLVLPGDTLRTKFTMNPGRTSGCPTLRFGLARKGQIVLELADWQPCIHESPTLELIDVRYPTGIVEETKAQLQCFDSEEAIVARENGTITQGLFKIDHVEGVNFVDEYRCVLIAEGSLPQQWYTHFSPGQNSQKAKTVWPIDKNQDGQFNLTDILNLYSQ